eukprot:gene9138-9306_t
MARHIGDLAVLHELPVVKEFYAEDWLVQDTWRDVPYDWSTLLENVLDASHVPFTHHKSISNRNTLGDYTMSLSGEADTYVTALRRWILQFGGGGPFGPVGASTYIEQLQPRLSHQQLLDRYSQHTANCAQCQRALKQLERVKNLLEWLTSVAAALTVLAAAVGVMAAATGSTGSASAAAVVLTNSSSAGIGSTILWKVLGVITGLASKFYNGDYPPPRNTDRQ